MISTSHGLVGCEASMGSSHGGASISSVVAGAVVVGASRDSKTASSGSRDSTDFRVAVSSGAVGLAALPELHAGALSVAVAGTGAESLLLLVVLHEENLDESAEQEEEGADDGDGKAGGVELADRAKRGGVGDLVAAAVGTEAFLGVGGSVTERCLNAAGALGCAVAGQDGDGDHGAAAEDVEEYAEESKDFLKMPLVHVSAYIAKEVLTFPPRKQVNRTAKMVYSTVAPARPVTACCQTGMLTSRSASTDRK